MIIFLGWGSLIWNQNQLPVIGEWREDGPHVKVEFVRQSADGRLTLVLTDNARTVASLWAIYDGDDVAEGCDALRQREKCNINSIGIWKLGESAPPNIIDIQEWADRRSVSAVIWTNLPAKFNEIVGKVPTKNEVVNYLNNLDNETRKIAEEYIRRTPKQIKTEYRKEIETQLGWHSLSDY